MWSKSRQVAICDFADDSWKIFASIEAALQAQLPRGVKLRIPYWPTFEPAFSGDGRIAVFVPPGTLHSNAADEWRRWDLSEVFTGREELIGAPFFSAELCKTAHGRTVAVFSADGADPFQYSEGVFAAHVDDEGHAFLDATAIGNDHEQVFLKPHVPPPRTTARLVEVGGGAARIALNAEPAEGAWFTWRIDGGEWRAVEGDGELRTGPTAAGEHRIDIRAWNAELIPDPRGASVAVRISGSKPH